MALLTGSGLWRTASLPQHGIEDIIMTDGTYGVRYSSAQIDGREKWSMDDFYLGHHPNRRPGQRGRARR
ncbi:beta-glucosidase [Klebsiella michiganensis]|uniref:Beta-glucosidase n=1 Tax=Klebsiella michiganensis TaxID=1134687 RepID=A0A7H4N0T8_9ENTR|nr:beta-glucosidase [Klebsiella michiganensis]